MTNEVFYNQVFNLDCIDIQEGAHGESYDRIDFNYKSGIVNGHGHYELVGDDLNFYVCYQIEGEMFDIEHIKEGNEECVGFNNIEPYTGYASIVNGVVGKIEIIEHPSKGNKKWKFSAPQGQRFLMLTKFNNSLNKEENVCV